MDKIRTFLLAGLWAMTTASFADCIHPGAVSSVGQHGAPPMCFAPDLVAVEACPLYNLDARFNPGWHKLARVLHKADGTSSNLLVGLLATGSRKSVAAGNCAHDGVGQPCSAR